MYLFPNTRPIKPPDYWKPYEAMVKTAPEQARETVLPPTLAPWQQAVEDWYTDSGAAMRRSLEDRDYRMPEEDRQNVLRQQAQAQKDEEVRAWQATIDQVVEDWNLTHPGAQRKTDSTALYGYSIEELNEDDDTMGTDQNPQKTASQEQVGGDHYLKMGVQPWDVIDNGPIVQAIGYYRWTALAYLMRAGTKDPLLQDLKKAKHVLSKLVELIEGECDGVAAD